uniref:GDT1 family protein n=1 Tax=Timema bartmani TaxID=61472 RepID=A0A7R9F6E9_9NEOP|nr:unnamed protein product [Timema bartmani]
MFLLAKQSPLLTVLWLLSCFLVTLVQAEKEPVDIETARTDSIPSVKGHILDKADIEMLDDGSGKISNLGFIHAFVAALSVIIVSELGDKTFFIAAIMAMRHPRLTVFLGAISALAFMTILSVAFGWVATLIPRAFTYYISTALFAIFGLKMLKEGYSMSDNEGQEEFDEVQQDLRKREDELSEERRHIQPTIVDITSITPLSQSSNIDQHSSDCQNSLCFTETTVPLKFDNTYIPKSNLDASLLFDHSDAKLSFEALKKHALDPTDVKLIPDSVENNKLQEANETKLSANFGSRLHIDSTNIPAELFSHNDDLDLPASSTKTGVILDPNSVEHPTNMVDAKLHSSSASAHISSKLAANKDVVGVAVGGVLGHSLCTGLAVMGGRMIAQRISVRTVTLIGGAVFLLFAITALFFDPNAE